MDPSCYNMGPYSSTSPSHRRHLFSADGTDTRRTSFPTAPSSQNIGLNCKAPLEDRIRGTMPKSWMLLHSAGLTEPGRGNPMSASGVLPPSIYQSPTQATAGPSSYQATPMISSATSEGIQASVRQALSEGGGESQDPYQQIPEVTPEIEEVFGRVETWLLPPWSDIHVDLFENKRASLKELQRKAELLAQPQMLNYSKDRRKVALINLGSAPCVDGGVLLSGTAVLLLSHTHDSSSLSIERDIHG